MTIKANSTLRPGLLVSLKTTVTGNVRYEKRTIEREHLTRGGASKATWETSRTISDPEEHDRAGKTRSKARSLIAAVCANSSFGLLCPDNAVDDLEAAIREARAVADEFNATAQLSRVSVYVITGRIAPDDVEAVRAINSEVRELLEEMRQGLRDLDVKTVRDAANRARNLGTMLSPEAAARIQIAIDAARNAARSIAKAGDEGAQEIDRRAIRKITEQRTAFLDLDDANELRTPEIAGRAIDLTPDRGVKTLAAQSRSIDME